MARTPKSNDNAKDKKGMTQISISLPTRLVDEIDKMAEMDNRNRSNFIANMLDNMAREFQDVNDKNK